MVTSTEEHAVAPPFTAAPLPKAPTGITGLDEITGGGLPCGRPTLVTGAAGCGKTLLGIEFLVRGAIDHGEPGVLLAFEETATDIAANVASLGYDLVGLEASGQLVIDAFHLDPAEFVETGAYDLEGLFIRLACAIDAIGAKRVVLDTIEVLFGALGDAATVRAELGRLFRWLKDRGLTTIVTGEKGDGVLTRHGIEEYVSDCVITLDHRVSEQICTRRLRVVKYRGSLHGTNEFPFLITKSGIVVLPITSAGLNHDVSTERVSAGIPRLDHMLGGGIFRGSSVLISGEAGTGKTTLAASMLRAACVAGERALFVSFEESPAQLVRNAQSVGIDLQRWRDDGLLQVMAMRPTAYGLEMHLAELLRLLDEFQPTIVALDAITSLAHNGLAADVTSLITREIDILKARGVTCVLTSLSRSDEESSSTAVSSLIDTWLLVRNIETNGERNRLLFVRKSRGSAHSNQVREFVISSAGLDLIDVPIGPNGALVGSARLAAQLEHTDAARRRGDELDRRRLLAERRRAEVELQIAALQRALDEELADLQRFESEDVEGQTSALASEAVLGAHRWLDAPRGPVLAGSKNGATP